MSIALVLAAGADGDLTEMIQNYLKEIEELRAKLVESESVCQQLRRNLARNVITSRSPLGMSPSGISLDTDIGSGNVGTLIAQAKRDLQKDMEALARGKEAVLSPEMNKKNGHTQEESDHSESEEGKR